MGQRALATGKEAGGKEDGLRPCALISASDPHTNPWVFGDEKRLKPKLGPLFRRLGRTRTLSNLAAISVRKELTSGGNRPSLPARRYARECRCPECRKFGAKRRNTGLEKSKQKGAKLVSRWGGLRVLRLSRYQVKEVLRTGPHRVRSKRIEPSKDSV